MKRTIVFEIDSTFDHAKIVAVVIGQLVKWQRIASLIFEDDFKSRLFLDGTLIGKTPTQRPK